MMSGRVFEGVANGADQAFDAAFFVAFRRIAQTDIKPVEAGKVEKGRIVGERCPREDHRTKVVVAQGPRRAAELLKGQQMSFDKKLERVTRKQVSKRQTGITEDNRKS